MMKLVNDIKEANCITHSGKFHVDDVISTIFLSKIKENIVLFRIATIDNNLDFKNKLVYDIGLRRVWSPPKK